MEYLLLIYADESEIHNATPEQIEGHAAAFGAFLKEVLDRGVMRAGAPLRPSTVATTVKVRDGKTLTTDGPFMETKEALAGYYHLECKDLDEALEFAAKIPAAQAGTIEVRPVWHEMADLVGKHAGAPH